MENIHDPFVFYKYTVQNTINEITSPYLDLVSIETPYGHVIERVL